MAFEIGERVVGAGPFEKEDGGMTKTEEDRMLLRKVIVGRWALFCAGKWGDDVPPCALCERYARKFIPVELSCGGCPIFEKTGIPQCAGTPFPDWQRGHACKAAYAMTDWLWELYDELTEEAMQEKEFTTYQTKSPVVSKTKEPLPPQETPAQTATRLDGQERTVLAKCGKSGKLDEEADRVKIAQIISALFGARVLVTMVDTWGNITRTGKYTVGLVLAPGLKATVVLDVVPYPEPTKHSEKLVAASKTLIGRSRS